LQDKPSCEEKAAASFVATDTAIPSATPEKKKKMSEIRGGEREVGGKNEEGDRRVLTGAAKRYQV